MFADFQDLISASYVAPGDSDFVVAIPQRDSDLCEGDVVKVQVAHCGNVLVRVSDCTVHELTDEVVLAPVCKVFHRNASMEKRLDEVRDLIKEKFMGLSQELKDLVDKFDEATNEIAKDLADLRGSIKNSMTDDEVTAIKDSIQAKVDRLTELGKDPTDPVP